MFKQRPGSKALSGLLWVPFQALFSLFQAWKEPWLQQGKIPLAMGTGRVCHSSSASRLTFSSGLQPGLGPPCITTALFLACFLEAEVWWVTGRASRPGIASHSSGQARSQPTSPGLPSQGSLPLQHTASPPTPEPLRIHIRKALDAGASSKDTFWSNRTPEFSHTYTHTPGAGGRSRPA